VSWLWQAIGLFAVTNIDDIVVLSLFFSRANRAPGSTRRIVTGQYLGFSAILAVSIAGALGAAQLPHSATGYLGLVPIAIGLHAARKNWRHRHDDDPDTAPATISAWTVAGVTFSNGGDNIGVYIPAFATYSAAELEGTVAVFLILVAAWCAAGYYVTAQPAVLRAMQRFGDIIYPLALIAIGFAILIRGGAFGL